MSNPVTIDRIAFQQLNASGEILGTNYGLRCTGDHGSEYINMIEGLTSLLRMQPRDLVRLAGSLNEKAAVMIAHAISHNQPIFIDEEPIQIGMTNLHWLNGLPGGSA
ncbi:hypothetical protein ACCS81_08355 [Rhizobium ruizarguesonis]